jgi:hypothetical protein
MTTLHHQMHETAQRGDEEVFLEQREEVIRLFLITYIQVGYCLFIKGSETCLGTACTYGCTHLEPQNTHLKTPTSPIQTSEGMMRQLSWSNMRRSSDCS